MNRTKKGFANEAGYATEQTEISAAIFIYGNVHLFHFYQMVDLP